ncbi:glycosyltransferase family 4 protein [Actinosynnema sp. NPDC047251]|uniref:Glycosyltransferase, family 4 n=1 Tax=Saccharothrix espanaensis (strain ATCC 51144 / DSM 44229 / JCM 9112 / NBRC 15066 / NRRL 15764) TaxID=1179773 RepID=K0KD61_SACES|nr:glycosyltransferase family 4 protein [Saccharothrix espanaensis]CCH34493.1 Glycosyltransferase, family 4 [Saccharothrix espanaensis DSM 44229]
MRVLMLSWEYPPVVVGGLGRHVHAVATELARQGHDVVVLCRQPTGSDAVTHPTSDSPVEGVRLVRVAEDPAHLVFERDLVAWTLAMGHAMTRAGLALLRGWRPEVVHAHDWLVTHAAIALAEAAGVPLVATVHATEAGRHSGWLSQTLNQQVHSVEWWLANRADSLITCSAAMRTEVAHLFEVDPAGITVLHNGIEPRRWRVRPAGVAAAREEFAADGPLLLFFGRLEWEKGVQDLIAALPRIRRAHRGTRVVVAGGGTHRDWLVEQARKHRVLRSVRFVGHLPDRTLAAVLAAADAVVLPSRYEPFGIVALEAAAAGTPLVASTAGGLGEVVLDGVTGLSFAPGDVDGLARAVRSVLADRPAAVRRAKAAKARLGTDFDWARIAADTAGVYRAAAAREHGPLGRPKIATGNAFL